MLENSNIGMSFLKDVLEKGNRTTNPLVKDLVGIQLKYRTQLLVRKENGMDWMINGW